MLIRIDNATLSMNQMQFIKIERIHFDFHERILQQYWKELILQHASFAMLSHRLLL